MNDPIKKWANELNRVFQSQNRQKKKKEKNEEMVTIPSHKGNVNQNHVKTSPSLQLEWLSSRKQNTTKNVSENGGEGNLIHGGWGCKLI
jgi:hypothetical protein